MVGVGNGFDLFFINAEKLNYTTLALGLYPMSTQMDHMTLEELRSLARTAIENVRIAKDAFHAAANKLRELTDTAVALEKIIVEREIDTLFDDAAPWRLKEYIPVTQPLEQASPNLSGIEDLEEYDADFLMPPPLSPAQQEFIDAGHPLNMAFISTEPAPDAQDRDSILLNTTS